MEEQALLFRKIKIAKNISKFAFVFSLIIFILLIFINLLQGSFFKDITAYDVVITAFFDFYIFYLFIYYKKNGRSKIIIRSLLIYALYSIGFGIYYLLFYNLNSIITFRFFGFILWLSYQAVFLLLCLQLYLIWRKKIKKISIIKFIFIIAIILLLLNEAFKIYNYQPPIITLIVALFYEVLFQIIMLCIIYQSIINEGFYTNFIETFPVKY